jgi:hypothetical protein
MIKTKFLQTCIGISIVLLSLGFFFQSIQSAHAAPLSPQKFFQDGVNKIGKYQMLSFSSTEVLVWDSETGKSIRYSFEGSKWTLTKYQLPEKPL